MKVAILGAGDVGFHLAKVLSAEGHPVTVVDNDTDKLLRVEDFLDVMVMRGDAADPTTLDKAGVGKSDLLIAVTNSDTVNLLASLFGKKLGAKRTIVRTKDKIQFQGRKNFYERCIEYDHVLCSDELAAIELNRIIRDHRAVAVENFADGKIQIRRVKVSPEFPIVEKPLGEVELPEGSLIAAIFRDEEIIIPGGDDAIQPDDHILVVGRRDGVENFEDSIGGFKIAVRNVTIYSGGNIATDLAQSLAALKIKTKIIEPDQQRSRQFSEKLEQTTIVTGDSTDLDLMKEEKIGKSDVFVALSLSDEKNLLACQMAKALGASRTIALVQRSDYAPFVRDLDLDAAIVPRMLIAKETLAAIHRGAVASIAVIEEGKAEVIQVTVQDSDPVCGKPLSEVTFPRGAIVGAVARDEQIIIPRGDFIFSAADKLVIFTKMSVVPQLAELFPHLAGSQ